MGKQNIFYWKKEAEYESKYSLEESVKRLQEVVKSDWAFFLANQGVYGKVTRDYVRLRRIIPFVRNSFEPVFIGKFQYSKGRVVLKGAYSIHIFVKIFMGMWFSFVMIDLISSAISSLDKLFSGNANLSSLTLLLVPFVMLIFGIALVLAGQFFARNDIDRISEFINETLGGKSR